MGRPRLDLTGQVFGKLTVESFAETRGSQSYWNILCECGNRKAMQRSGIFNYKSCGCEGGVEIHGMWKHPLYLTWQNIITRCYNPKSVDYKDYGGRGILVSHSWLDVRNFIADMNPKPANTQIDRRDNNLGYSKENCRWASKVENNQNRRNSVKVEYQGKLMSLKEAEALCGVSSRILEQRIRLGKNPDIFRK